MACSHQYNPSALCLQNCRGKAQKTRSQCQWTITTGITVRQQGGIHGIGPPTWDPEARAGIYLDHSPFHAGNVALLLNLQTGHTHTECATEESFNMASSWYEGEEAHRTEPVDTTEEMRE
eukprot:15338108-Ditylum_brightwellii.AAC.2